MNITIGTIVSVRGFIGSAEVVELLEDDWYQVRGTLNGEVIDWDVDRRSITPVDDEHPVVGTLYLDPATGDTYRLRGWSTDWANMSDRDSRSADIGVHYATGGMGVYRDDLASVIALGATAIWTPSALTRA